MNLGGTRDLHGRGLLVVPLLAKRVYGVHGVFLGLELETSYTEEVRYTFLNGLSTCIM